jgi:microcystin-dependent protein
LDSAGRINEVWIPEGTNSKFVLKTSTNVLIGTYDSLFPIASLPVSIYNGGTGATTAEGARINLGLGTFLVPTGSIVMWPSSVIPSDWKLCNGDALSRTTFATLFSLVGTTFGVGDGTTTFNLPNYKNRMPYGADTYAVGATGGAADAVLVSHTHTATTNVTDPGHTHTFTTGNGNVDHTHLLNTYIGVNASGGATGYAGNNSGGGAGASEATQASGSAHTHSGTTAAITTGVTVATSISTAGSSGTNANLSPYLAINFIIKT